MSKTSNEVKNRWKKKAGLKGFSVNLRPEEYTKLDTILQTKQINKTEYLRFCIERDYLDEI